MSDYDKLQALADDARASVENQLDVGERVMVIVIGDDGGYRISDPRRINISIAVGVLTRAAAALDRWKELAGKSRPDVRGATGSAGERLGGGPIHVTEIRAGGGAGVTGPSFTCGSGGNGGGGRPCP